MNARALALVLAAIVAPLAGCRVDDMVSLQVGAICAPPDDPTQCVIPAECEPVFIGISRLDTSESDTLQLFVQVINQNTDTASERDLRGNSRDAYVTEMEVEYDSPVAVSSWRSPIGPFVVPAEGATVMSVYPIDDATPGAARALDDINDALAANGDFRLVANVRLRGKYQDERTFETAVWPVTIDVCDGCLATPFDCDLATTGVQTLIACPRLGQSPASRDCVD